MRSPQSVFGVALVLLFLSLCVTCALGPQGVSVELLFPESGWAGFPDEGTGGAWRLTVTGSESMEEHVVSLGAGGGLIELYLPLAPAILHASYCWDEGVCVSGVGARFPDDVVTNKEGSPQVSLTWEAGQLAELLTRATAQGLAPDALNWAKARNRLTELCADSAAGTVFLDEVRFLRDLAEDNFSIYSLRAADREELDPPAPELAALLRPLAWGLSLDADAEEQELPVGRTAWAMRSGDAWVRAELEVDDRGHWWLRPAQ